MTGRERTSKAPHASHQAAAGWGQGWAHLAAGGCGPVLGQDSGRQSAPTPTVQSQRVPSGPQVVLVFSLGALKPGGLRGVTWPQ